MSNNPEPTTDPGQPAIYQIRLKGHIGSQWTDWFDGLAITLELAGVIEAVGKGVTRFRPGDAVFASTFAVDFGGHAEYKCLPENGVIALKPAVLTYEEAAAVPGAAQTAWRCLQKGQIQPVVGLFPLQRSVKNENNRTKRKP